MSSLEQLKAFLNQLFQFENQDLDFGIYKILHYKRTEIKQFIDQLLVDEIQTALSNLTEEEADKLKKQIAFFEGDNLFTMWKDADNEQKKLLESLDKTGALPAQIAQYTFAKQILNRSTLSAEAENQIYNHLVLFFARYYDKGDFISKRRFGKNEKYMLPYNGEETHFYWANYDQYYIKSSETFQKFAFKTTHTTGNLIVECKLTQAQTEQGNVKADENRYFILSNHQPAQLHPPKDTNTDAELHLFFEYRPLSDTEKTALTGNNKQDTLNEQAALNIENQFKKQTLTYQLWQTNSKNQSLLLQKLHHYTRKNKYDFFIHKDLKGFLSRELDFYIKNELLNIDNLYVSETETHFDHIRQNLKTIKVFKQIADTLIEFLTQIETFQKKLWEKKKFVLNTHWIITLDKLVQFVGEQNALPIIQTALKNPKQTTEWQQLFGSQLIPNNPQLQHLYINPTNNTDMFAQQQTNKIWRKLPIDTALFDAPFAENLLNLLSQHINLEENTNGQVLHSDNFHGLTLLQDKFKEKIKCIYIDPPYNTGGDGFLYKDGFQRSAWLTMFQNKIAKSFDLIKTDGVVFSSIDDYEHNHLIEAFNSTLGEENFISNIIWQKKFSPQNDAKWLSDNHDFIVCYAKHKQIWRPTLLPRTDEQNERYQNPDNDYRGVWSSSGLDVRTYAADYDYPITTPNGRVVYPPKGRCWRCSKDRFAELVADNRIWWGENGTNVPRIKRFLSEVKDGVTPLTVWTYQEVGHNQEATQEVKKLGFYEFSSPKPIRLIQKVLTIGADRESTILDFFAGSGTTFHATQVLNREDGGSRKCILVEQGGYVYTVIIPRIKKVAYSFDWKEGIPKDDSMNGLGVFMKYQRLEQYEECLENISFTPDTATVQQAMQLSSYIPKYALHFETRNSPTLLNTAQMQNPWGYTLKTWDGFTYDTIQTIDLIETFNYLIGLHVQKQITQTINNHKYQFVWGNNAADKQVLVVWRNTIGWGLADFEADKTVLNEQLSKFSYSVLYINNQAAIEQVYLPIEEVFKNKMS